MSKNYKKCSFNKIKILNKRKYNKISNIGHKLLTFISGAEVTYHSKIKLKCK